MGLDLAKRTMEVCIVTDGETGLERVSRMKTDGKGMEACAYAFVLARYLLAEVGCVVYIMNPGKRRMIGQSTKKTDQEDALKSAKFFQRYPKENLPLVSLPTEREVRHA